jgi:hypothetical protein
MVVTVMLRRTVAAMLILDSPTRERDSVLRARQALLPRESGLSELRNVKKALLSKMKKKLQ